MDESNVSTCVKARLAVSALKGSITRFEHFVDIWECSRYAKLDQNFAPIYEYLMSEIQSNLLKVNDVHKAYMSIKK